MDIKEIYEIQIKKVSELSDIAKEEVARKLSGKSERFKKRFRGYVKLNIAYAPHLCVEPIEGDIINYWKKLISVKNLKM